MMEKKTIGKLIAALRRANGMTQRELGERLFVSDKTVSRWECDECTPELSLIPAIAELFGITTDELLRGECNAPGEAAGQSEETAARKRGRGERQFKSMLQRRVTRYQSLSLVSSGIAIAGLITAAIANLCFSRALIGFWLGALLLLGSGICQLCFARTAYLHVEEEDEVFLPTAQVANDGVVRTAVHVFALILALLGFMLPLLLVGNAYLGLSFGSWARAGSAFTVLMLALLYVLYVCLAQPLLVKRGLLHPTEQEGALVAKRKALLQKTLLIVVIVLLVLLAVLLLLNHLPRRLFAKAAVFDDWDAYYAFLEENKHEGYTVRFSGGEGLLPATVYSTAAMRAADAEVAYYSRLLLLAIPLTLLLAAAAYAVLLHRACRQK